MRGPRRPAEACPPGRRARRPTAAGRCLRRSSSDQPRELAADHDPLGRRSSPASRAMVVAVAGWSPVTTTVWMPPRVATSHRVRDIRAEGIGEGDHGERGPRRRRRRAGEQEQSPARRRLAVDQVVPRPTSSTAVTGEPEHGLRRPDRQSLVGAVTARPRGRPRATVGRALGRPQLRPVEIRCHALAFRDGKQRLGERPGARSRTEVPRVLLRAQGESEEALPLVDRGHRPGRRQDRRGPPAGSRSACRSCR